MADDQPGPLDDLVPGLLVWARPDGSIVRNRVADRYLLTFRFLRFRFRGFVAHFCHPSPGSYVLRRVAILGLGRGRHGGRRRQAQLGRPLTGHQCRQLVEQRRQDVVVRGVFRPLAVPGGVRSALDHQQATVDQAPQPSLHGPLVAVQIPCKRGDRRKDRRLGLVAVDQQVVQQRQVGRLELEVALVPDQVFGDVGTAWVVVAQQARINAWMPR